MAMSLNRAQIIGNLTRDPEVREIPGGQTVANFSVATNFVWTDAAGQRQERVEYHNIVAWRKLAEIISQYLRKGSKVYVEGRIQTREWDGQDGVKRYKTEIVADNVIMLDRKGALADSGMNAGGFDAGSAAGLGTGPRAVSAQNSGVKLQPEATAQPTMEEEVKLEDLPF